MSTVFLGHSGQRIAFDPSSISTVEALRSFIAQHGIQARNQILLTSTGKQVRTPTLLTEYELFVFDSSLLNTKSGVPTSAVESSSSSDVLDDFSPGTPPDTIANQNDLQAWHGLFRVRRSWASALFNGCETRARLAERYQDEQLVIERSLGVAVASLQQHIKGAEQKYAATESSSEDTLRDLEQHVNNWEANLHSLREIPARAEFSRFIQTSPNPSSRRLSQQGSLSTLQGFVDVSSVRNAANTVKSTMTAYAQKVTKMGNDLDAARKEGDELLDAVDKIGAQSSSNSSSEPDQLLGEIKMVVRKMASDLEHVQSLPPTPQSVSQASKMALLHTRNYLPNLGDFCSEMNELVRRARHQRDSAAETALEHMRMLSSIESTLAELYQDIRTLELPQDEQRAIPTLGVVSRLASVYGSLLVEAVRRREWVEKMKRDCETLQEEVATYQYEEDKRRKRWVESVEDVCRSDSLLPNVLGIELSLQNEGGSWPNVTRNELQDYLKVLTEVYGSCDVTSEMEQAIKDLDKPTRKQIKHAKAFKNGSMHEPFGGASLMLRGEEQYKSLREVNARLEDELKGQKSRVRKLEDLLHRQTHISRAGSGDMFAPRTGSIMTPPSLATPLASEDALRQNAMKHRRLSSATKDLEEKRLARRVVDLEAELDAAKQEASSRKSSDVEVQKQFEEAVSTKQDLMENMEAQQREFATERRGLEKDLAEAKERVEELENEIERLVGSRDEERTGTDARAVAYEREIARLKEDATAHAARAAAEQDTRSALEKKLELAEAAQTTAEAQIRKLQTEKEEKAQEEVELLQLLATTHSSLSSEADMPSSLMPLVTAVDELARKTATHTKDLADAIAFARSENDSYKSSGERLRTDLAAANEKQSEAEAQARHVQEQLSSEEARAQSLDQQLREEQEQLRILRLQIADGETGSEVLRRRVAEEESRAGKLASELAEAKSHVNSLDVELMRLQKVQRLTQEAANTSTKRLEHRAEYAKHISQRLLAHNLRAIRLLERLGLAISYADGEMVVERASKLGASTSMHDTRDPLNRTVSLTSPPLTRKSSAVDDTSDISLLRWTEASSVEDEAAQFEAFIQQVSRFNLDTFGDAVVKRLRDFEYTAKKYNKEAKESSKRADAYKERSAKLKGEAHAKIAVKDFKEGDLALFLPTRGQAKGAWAAFNINCPHYFLAEKEGMHLGSRDFIVGRISKIDQKVVDLSKTASTMDRRSIDDTSDAVSFADNDNPFDLSDGLTWWLVHAVEERGAGGAPSTPGLGKSTVAAANVDAKGSIRIKRSSKGDDASKHLNKSLDSRRSSSASKRSVAGALVPTLANTGGGSPTVATFADATASASASPRPNTRSGSVAEIKPLPAASTGGVGNSSNTPSGLSITTTAATPGPSEEQQRQQILINDPSSSTADNNNNTRMTKSGILQHDHTAQRLRSTSPSRSIRSLQRHLNPRSSSSSSSQQQQNRPASPAKTRASTPSTAKQKQSQQQPQGWESLWQADFTLESPSKRP